MTWLLPPRRLTGAATASILVLALLAALLTSRIASREQALVVHEWGTFTSFQLDDGTALAGINTDDEPVPAFVHGFGRRVLQPALRTWPTFPLMKGIPRRHPQVTMRLETPVIYFYPPAGEGPLVLDVEVGLRGGWLSEFYPKAAFTAPGLKEMALSGTSLGTLGWQGLKVGTGGAGPETDEEVWLAPRRVRAASVTTPEGESEKYLFYRGVGQFDAPLRVNRDVAAGQIALHSNLAGVLAKDESLRIPGLWLIHVKQDGRLAWRTIDPVAATADAAVPLTTVSDRFDEADFSADNFAALRAEMHRALVADGLYADEADAMLETWKHAYFKTSGLRLFFVVPRKWTDDRMPLTLSRPAQIERVMMGRIELLTGEQRSRIALLRKAPIADQGWLSELAKLPASPAWDKLYTGQSDFGELSVDIPPAYQAYLDLGRFRNALVLDEWKRRPTPSLKKFVQTYGLAPWWVLRQQAVLEAAAHDAALRPAARRPGELAQL